MHGRPWRARDGSNDYHDLPSRRHDVLHPSQPLDSQRPRCSMTSTSSSGESTSSPEHFGSDPPRPAVIAAEPREARSHDSTTMAPASVQVLDRSDAELLPAAPMQNDTPFPWFSGQPRPQQSVTPPPVTLRTHPFDQALATPGSSEVGSDRRIVTGWRGIDHTWSHSPQDAHWDAPDHHTTREDIRQLLSQIRPDDDLDALDATSQPSGLSVQLLPHQISGVAWMKRMEDGATKGGILADDMGLGKTVQAIAVMLERPPPCAGRPTLVVAPVALLDQWYSVLHRTLRPSHTPWVTVLHGSRARRPWRDVARYDVVLTTYSTLVAESRRLLSWRKRLQADPTARRTEQEECPMLDDGSRFHRVILDEAHVIKNAATQMATVACQLRAEVRWCLTGTPMQNRVDEIHSLIKFCRIRPYDDTETFARDIGRPLRRRGYGTRTRAMEKLQALLKAVVLRRMKSSTVAGRPILQLPAKHEVTERVVFDQDQLDFYRALEEHAQIQFNRYVEKGEVGQNHAKALVLLLRLRQCCCSPQLITHARDFVTYQRFAHLDLRQNACMLAEAVVRRIQDHPDQDCPVCMDGVDNPTVLHPCGHTMCADCFSQVVEQVRSGDLVPCPRCRATVDPQAITDWESVRQVWWSKQDGAPADLPVLASKEMVLRRLGHTYRPCAKIERLVHLLHEIDGRGGGEKTIVFSNFTSFLDLVEVRLRRDPVGTNYVRYDGSMTVSDRSRALLRFTRDAECRVALLSLRAGNAGLNLSVANHVVILDPFWNPFLELQAADRCHRIGQQREVTVHRLLIGADGADGNSDADGDGDGDDEGNTHREWEQDGPSTHGFTIEDRIMRLQARKREMVDSVFDEHAGRMMGTLGTRELGYLFGLNPLPAQQRT